MDDLTFNSLSVARIKYQVVALCFMQAGGIRMVGAGAGANCRN